MNKFLSGVCFVSVVALAATLTYSDSNAGPSVGRAGSGTFDMNSIDCNNLDKLNPRFKRMAERKCRENQPTYKISNTGNVDSEPTPSDVYKGKDKKELKNMILAAWKEKYPKDDILGVRFHMKDWKRNTNVKANATSLYKTDTSVLAVSVVVKDNASTATIFPAYINKDNLDGSLNTGVATKKSEYVVKQMLVKNWKP